MGRSGAAPLLFAAKKREKSQRERPSQICCIEERGRAVFSWGLHVGKDVRFAGEQNYTKYEEVGL